MGKYILYLVIAFIIAFAANFFGVVDIPWLDPPFATDRGYYTEGTDKKNRAVEEIFEQEKK